MVLSLRHFVKAEGVRLFYRVFFLFFINDFITRVKKSPEDLIVMTQIK